MNNYKIRDLRISANEIGNTLGLVLGKVLQVRRFPCFMFKLNDTIETLYFDGNKMNYRGFKMFHVGLDRNTTLTCVPYPSISYLNSITF